MTPAELRCLRETLGLTITELAVVLGLDARAAPPIAEQEPALARSARKAEPLNERTVRRWETGAPTISKPNGEAFARLLAYTDQAIAALVDGHRPGQPIITHANDHDLRRAHPDLWPSLPASWHRAVAWRAAQQIPGAVITYDSPGEPATEEP
jgi:transcriptional regulator with XRE-family HTH domain